MRSRIILAALLVTSSSAARAAPPPTEKPRLVILTDISSLTTGEAEPDDGQSLIRLMLPACLACAGRNERHMFGQGHGRSQGYRTISAVVP